MPFKFSPIDYRKLSPREKESFNFQKVSAVLADYGLMTLRLCDDWKGADFIAQHIDGKRFLKVQLKGRLSFNKKYSNKDLYIVFPHDRDWYLYPHDELLNVVLSKTNIGNTESWAKNGIYHFPRPSSQILKILAPYRLGSFIVDDA